MNRLRLYIVLIIALFFSAAYLANKSNNEKPKTENSSIKSEILYSK